MEKFFYRYVQKVAAAQDDLLASLTPGELGVDILPATTRKSEIEPMNNYKLVVFQLNVALWPNKECAPQALSVRLAALDTEVQFADVSPTSRHENVGSYKIGVSNVGKFTYSAKDTAKAAVSLNIGAAKMGSNLGREETVGEETTTGVSVEETQQTYSSLIIAAPLKDGARWELYRGPGQPLVGGNTFLATAFVPSGLTEVALEARVRAELDHYGVHEVTVQRSLALPPVTAPTLVIPLEGSSSD